jgi:hypothetical protein
VSHKEVYSTGYFISIAWDAICFILFSNLAYRAWRILSLNNGESTFTEIVQHLISWPVDGSSSIFIASAICVICAVTHIILSSVGRIRLAAIFRNIQSASILIVIIMIIVDWYQLSKAGSWAG